MTRTPCCILGCRCSTKHPCREWICEKHWKMVPKALKRQKAHIYRIARRSVRRRPLYAEWWKLPAGSTERLTALGLWRRCDQAWNACKEAAQRAAVGL